MSTFQLEGSAFGSAASNVKVQFARPSARRSSLALGSFRSMRGMATVWLNSASGDRRSSTCLRLAISGVFDQSGLPRVRSSAITCGHGTQARQPPWPSSRSQRTARLPLMANGRCSTSDTLALMVGLRRFQSKVEMITTNTTTSRTTIPPIQARVLRVRVMVRLLYDDSTSW